MRRRKPKKKSQRNLDSHKRMTDLIPVFDGHNDVLLHLLKHDISGRSFFEHTEGHVDLPRCLAGGFAGGFFAVFVPTPSQGFRDSSPRFDHPVSTIGRSQ